MKNLSPKNKIEIIKTEYIKCRLDVEYWIENYVYIYDVKKKEWALFKLWPEQKRALGVLKEGCSIVFCKARQLGITWLVNAHELHAYAFPGSTILGFSKGESEAIKALDRFKDMYFRLPHWIQSSKVTLNSAHEFKTQKGSLYTAKASTGGRSFTANTVIIDEAEFIVNLQRLLTACKPTINDGGKILMPSTVDKDKPKSIFKNTFSNAIEELNDYSGLFFGWSARPDRDDEWYKKQCDNAMADEGTLDNVWQEYPATVEQAFAPRELGKRLTPAHLLNCYQKTKPLEDCGLDIDDDFRLYRKVKPGITYVIGSDTSEGLEGGDPSGFVVLDETGYQVAALQGIFEPHILGSLIAKVSIYFNNAPVMVERNNHGHAVLLWLRDNSQVRRLTYVKDNREGWLSSSVGKVLMYDAMAESIKDIIITITDDECFNQLASIEKKSLAAPKGLHDDAADSFTLANAALKHSQLKVEIEVQSAQRGGFMRRANVRQTA